MPTAKQPLKRMIKKDGKLCELADHHDEEPTREVQIVDFLGSSPIGRDSGYGAREGELPGMKKRFVDNIVAGQFEGSTHYHVGASVAVSRLYDRVSVAYFVCEPVDETD